MSIRNALLIGMLSVVIVSTSIVSLIGIWSLERNVWREAQERVNRNLDKTQYQFNKQLAFLAKSLGGKIEDLSLHANDINIRIEKLKQEFGLTVINICDADGIPVAGSYPDKSVLIPVVHDPVMRRALEGKLSWGTVKLDSERLELEGGSSLKNLVVVNTKDNLSEPATTSALFWWIAYPIKNENGRVTGLLYGGRTLNYNFEFVDEMRNLLFTEKLYKGKPVGTVTIFLEGTRIATNVVGPDNKRAIGTFVSNEVYDKVLDHGEIWYHRAWVVDEWYISGYSPLKDPHGEIIGMLYVGLLEAPYNALKIRMISILIVPVLLIVIGAVTVTLILVHRITISLNTLSVAAVNMSRGNWEKEIEVSQSFREINDLSRVFNEMKVALADRDKKLQEKNQILEDTNENLNRVNRHYMEMLGFITHELKSPLAAIYNMISVTLDGLAGDVPEKVHHFLIRIKRNAEELQDMVKNYLDLSRVERGELVANISDIDFICDVINPAVEQTSPLFRSRDIVLEVDSPKQLNVKVDSELMRIALSNYLTNAAKYGFEGGKARLEVKVIEGNVEVQVWNEGHGFTHEEKKNLFNKFSRLRNPLTRNVRGSGLGLFLCNQILDLHKGKVWAESEPEKWASFISSFPVEQ